MQTTIEQSAIVQLLPAPKKTSHNKGKKA